MATRGDFLPDGDLLRRTGDEALPSAAGSCSDGCECLSESCEDLLLTWFTSMLSIELVFHFWMPASHRDTALVISSMNMAAEAPSLASLKGIPAREPFASLCKDGSGKVGRSKLRDAGTAGRSRVFQWYEDVSTGGDKVGWA